MTIVEMLVAIGVFMVGIIGFTVLFADTWRSNAYTIEMGQSSMAVSQGLNKMVSYIRSAKQADNGAFPVSSGSSSDLVLYSDYDKDGITERLHFYLDNQNVLMGVKEPSGTMPKTYSSGDQSVVTIAQRIVNTASEPIFYYYDVNYAGDPSDSPLATPVDVSSVRLIKIHLKINIDPLRAPDNVEMQTFVELRNLNDYNP